MTWSSRRATIVLTAVALLGVMSILPLLQEARGQKALPVQKRPPGIQPPGGQPPGTAPGTKTPTYDLGRLSLPKDDDLKDKFDAAEDEIKNKDWKRACEILQKLVGRQQDVFVPRERKDKEGNTLMHYVSAKEEAARIIGGLSKPGREAYEQYVDASAKQLYTQAVTNNTQYQMAQVLGLYLHSPWGEKAGNWLATYALDRGEFQGAARFYAILIQRGGLVALKDGQLVRASYAFHHAGDAKSKALVVAELERRAKQNEDKIGNVAIGDLKDGLDRYLASATTENASDSPMYRGVPSRSATLPGGTPFLEPAWTYKMTQDNKTLAFLKEGLDALKTENKHVFSSFAPVTATTTKQGKKVPLLVYRDYKGVTAVNVQTGKTVWQNPWMEWSLENVLNNTNNSNASNAYTQWWGSWKQNRVRPQILFENSVTGTLSADNKYVYVIEDVALPCPYNLLVNPNNQFGGIQPVPAWGEAVTGAINSNRLIAIRQSGGGAKWGVGGTEKTEQLPDSMFLGPPLVLNNKLYVLNEKQQQLRLVTIDPESGKVLTIQPLASTKDLKLAHDPYRRIQACHLAHGDGILVIPTNAGAVFGVDLLSGSLAWAYPYSEQMPAAGAQVGVRPGFGQPPPGFKVGTNGQFVPHDPNWLVTAPATQDGKVVFTAPDASAIHCVNLRDGTRVWTRPREQDDLYMAGVFNGKVVIVGQAKTRALNLNNGELAWNLDTGLPSGQGAASTLAGSTDTIYYLPIRQAVNTREPEVCAINVDKGIIHAHTRSRKLQVPGNLIFYEGTVLSQDHESVTAYPQLEVKLAEMNKKIDKDADDPATLTERGDYLLDKGDLTGAIADFRKALRQKKIEDLATVKAQARKKLYESYTELFQRDFAKAEEFIADYEDKCKIDLAGFTGQALTDLQAEQRRRRANFLCLVGKGRESQSRLVDAFKYYLELGQDSPRGELIQVIDEPSVKAAPDVWAQGRIAAMVAGATDAKQKAALEAEIKSRWTKLRNNRDVALNDLRNFVGLFGSLFGVGKEARFTLAEKLMEDSDVNSLLEAEQHLTLLRQDATPEIAGKAIESLARLNTRKGLLEDAAYYYRLLGERFPKVDIEGKKGAEYLEDLSNDKRFLPYLDQTGRFVIKGKVTLDAKQLPASTGYGSAYTLHNYGESLPFFLRHRLAFDSSSHNLRLSEPGSTEPRWSLRLNYTAFQSVSTNVLGGHASRVKFGFQNQGHLVVLSLGHRVFAIDPLNKGRIIWEKNLSQAPNSATSVPEMQPGPYPYDERDGAILVRYPDMQEQRMGGNTGPLTAGVVCIQMRDSLTAVDPVTGRTLWTRTDINSKAHVFGDDGLIYAVGMGQNNQASGTRVFRSYDGVSVKVPDFSNQYEKRLRVSGRHIIVGDRDAKEALTLKIYDILEGKDLFRQQFAAGTHLMQSEDPRLAGVIEPSGLIKVLDVTTQKEVLATKLDDPKHLDAPRSIHLVGDPDSLFIAINNKLDPNKVIGDISPNFTPGQGLRSVPVNGYLYNFDRATGKRRWYNPIENEHLVVTLFEDLPCLFLTARYSRFSGQLPFRNQVQAVSARVLAKHNGNLWWAPSPTAQGDEMFQMSLSAAPTFTGISMDHRTGQVEVLSYSMRVQLTAVPK